MVLLPGFGHVNGVEGLQPEAFEQFITGYYDTGTVNYWQLDYQPFEKEILK